MLVYNGRIHYPGRMKTKNAKECIANVKRKNNVYVDFIDKQLKLLYRI